MGSEKQYVIPAGVNILDYLRSKGIYQNAPCGGHGTCGKCKIKILAGSLPPCEIDKIFLTDKEIENGFRLSCQSDTKMPVRISLSNDSEDHYDGSVQVSGPHTDPKHDYGIAIDLGTTTLAATLMDMSLNKGILTRTSLNRQHVFGADVISRIEASLSGKAEELKRIVERDICELIESLCIPDDIIIRKVVIAGNTAMYHLLMETDVKGLSAFPFETTELGGIEYKRDQVLAYEISKRKVLPGDCSIFFVPGLSTFIGGDIFAGMLAENMINGKNNTFFIDIGTNAEMVLKKGNTFFTASAAAGPALEGGNLKCGTGSVPGAICKAEFDPSSSFGGHINYGEGVLKVKTIADSPPVGICGTGAIEAVYEFLRVGILNEYGTFSDIYIKDGFPLANSAMGEIIKLDQDDIRQIQMAKSAIRSGTDVLMTAAGIRSEDIETVYVSGGFGSFLDLKKASGIGLLPESLALKAVLKGNTSLKGAGMALERYIGYDHEIVKNNLYTVDLANDESFKEKYISNMNFDIKK